MHHTVPDEVSHRAVARLDGELEGDHPIGPLEKLDHARGEVRNVARGSVELLMGDSVGIEVFSLGGLRERPDRGSYNFV